MLQNSKKTRFFKLADKISRKHLREMIKIYKDYIYVN